jgi:hypothetical protein
LSDLVRVLKPGGILAGAIPTEGGLAWGAGRYLTSRRWLRKNTGIDPDKIICWEHPNYADAVIAQLDNAMHRDSVKFWPFSAIPLLDTNLIIRFEYSKQAVA